MGENFSNLVDMFEKSTARYRNNRLFGVKRDGRYEWMTYGEVGEQVAAFRGGLASLGVAKGDRVAIISNNRPEWAIAAYATYSLGAQFVPMYEAQLPKEWEYILEDSGAKVLIVPNNAIHEQTKDFPDHIDSLAHVIDLEGEASKRCYASLLKVGRDNPVPSVKPDPSEVCGFIYTSGTTGKPKGVLLSHGNITSNINAVHAIFPMSADDVSLCFLPWAHSFGQTVELHCMLSYGAAMGLVESVNTIIENLAEVRPTLLFSVPRIFNRIYDGVNKRMAAEGGIKKLLFDRTLTVAAERRALTAHGKGSSLLLEAQHAVLDKLVGAKIRERFGGRLRYAFSGGAALSKEVGEFVDSLGITVYEGYGLTETSPIATANYPGNQRIGSVGKAIPGVRVELGPAEVAPEGQGEIVVYGPNIMQGYHNLPEETAEVFTADGGFRTGDLGRIDSDGFVYITGRVKEQYKLENGKYVAPAPLEEKLKLSPFINNLMIDGTNRLYNIAVIVPDLENLREWARENGIEAADDEALCKDPAVNSQMEREIERYSTEFKRFERIGRFILTPEDFTTENDMLTPKMSLKRRNVLAKYGDAINRLYAE
ncbi:MAG: long-chain fatty acid--CoA ligase [Deltaproteobacteria bacterium]|nr:long-chain fatty acid--CoA ligase [Deltaproteobacteria bacterium]MCB9786317.1 long-chain fatty acid--CoA ligase [Deltaproteobacteria bacterium]